MVHKLFGCLALAAFVLVAPACEQDSEDSSTEYVDGQSTVTDDGAFMVTLSHEDGAPELGDNTFFVRVAVVDPAVDGDEGRGVPNLRVDLAAEMTNDDYSMESLPTFTYFDDGVYRVDGVLLDRAGDWSLDFNMGFGTIQEEVSFGFMVEG